MEFKKKSRILFVGDSITDCQRDYNAPLAGWGSFGEGYVTLINAFTMSLYPEKEYMIINKGISGDTIRDLEKRWQEDVINIHPDVVNIMIGINDVWRHFDSVFNQVSLIEIDEFVKIYRKLIQETLKETSNVVLLSAFMFEKNSDDDMKKMLHLFQKATEDLAIEFDLPFVDVQKKVDSFLIHQSNYALSSDRVHPSTISGHMLIAKAWLDKVEFQWDRG